MYSNIWFRITLVVVARWPFGPSGSVGAAGALAAAVTKAISAKGRRPAAANTLLSEVIETITLIPQALRQMKVIRTRFALAQKNRYDIKSLADAHLYKNFNNSLKPYIDEI